MKLSTLSTSRYLECNECGYEMYELCKQQKHMHLRLHLHFQAYLRAKLKATGFQVYRLSLLLFTRANLLCCQATLSFARN